MSSTERGDYLFTVKEHGDGRPWLMAELRDGEGLSVLGNGFIGIDFRDGVTLDQAEAIVRQMRPIVAGLSYTKLDD